jgi:hypothetical protein
LISSLIFSMTHWLLSNVLFSFPFLHIFCCCFCYWVLVSLHCNQIEFRVLFLCAYICWGLFCDLRYDVFWRKFHGLLRRMYIVLVTNDIFCRHQLWPFLLWFHLVLGFLCWFFVWTYLFVIIVIFFWYIAPFMSMKCSSLPRLTIVDLNSTLSNTNTAILSCFGSHWLSLLPAFHPKPVFISVNKRVSCK